MLYEIFMFFLMILTLIILIIANPFIFSVDRGFLKAVFIVLTIIWFSSRILERIGIRGDISAFIICLSIGWIVLQAIVHEPVKNDEAPDNDLKDKELIIDKSIDSKPIAKQTEESESIIIDVELERQTNTDQEHSSDTIKNRPTVMENNIHKLTCEICGGNDLVKENGLYICQHCEQNIQ